MDNSEIVNKNLLNIYNDHLLEIDKSRITIKNNKTNLRRVIQIGLAITFFTFYLTALYMQRIVVHGLSNTLEQPMKLHVNDHNLQSVLFEFNTEDEGKKKTNQPLKRTFLNSMDKTMQNYNNNNNNDEVNQPKNSFVYDETNGKKLNVNCKANVNEKQSNHNSIKRHNISTKSKYVKWYKNNRQQQKFISTTTTTTNSKSAEPIIYLFALIFIYLLIRAASDINDHYKTRNKNDKCMRRYSLQSYAQTHGHTERRTSKGISMKCLPE